MSRVPCRRDTQSWGEEPQLLAHTDHTGSATSGKGKVIFVNITTYKIYNSILVLGGNRVGTSKQLLVAVLFVVVAIYEF